MAEKKSFQTSKFGKYKTSTGGGEPMGEYSDKYPKGGRGVWKEAYDQEPKREEGQPRTDDGKFTYNAVNGKPLKEISKVNGHSRGTTISPELTGGVNGVHYYKDKYHEERVDGEKVKEHLESAINLSKLKKLVDEKNYESADEIYKHLFKRGAEIVGFDGKIKFSEEDFVAIYQQYDAEKGMYVGEDVAEWKSKTGRHSTKEKEAIKEAEDTMSKGSKFVEAKDGESDVDTGIKTKFMDAIKKHRTYAPRKSTTIAPSASTTESASVSADSGEKAPAKKDKYTSSQAKAIAVGLGMSEEEAGKMTSSDIEQALSELSLSEEEWKEVEDLIKDIVD